MGDFFTTDVVSGINTEDPERCGKGLKRYLLLIGAAATIILVATYWYSEYYSKGPGMRPSAAVGASPPPAAGAPRLANWIPPSFADSPPLDLLAPGPTPSRNGSAIDSQTPTPLPAKHLFSAIVDRIRNSVVNINVKLGAQAPMATPPTNGSILYANPVNPMRPQSAETIGSGIVIRNDGYILTNYHVVRGADTIMVTVFDDFGTERYPASIAKLEEVTDLALLKIKPNSPLVPAVLGDSDRIRVADDVIAIGSPFGLGQTVSRGIVSAVGRSLAIEGVRHSGLIQTDAAINQGNSGGPLVHENGTVIGINTAIYTPTGAFSGVGFAVPSNQAKAFILDEIELPNLRPAAAVGRTVAQQNQAGVAVGNAGPTIVAGVPAPHTDGREKMACANCHQIINRPAKGATGRAVAFNGYSFAQPPSSLAMNVMAAGPVPGSGYVLMGAGLQAIDAAIGKRLAHPPGKGLFVNSVTPGSPSERGGLKPGDIILKLDGKRVRSPEEMINRIRRLDNGEIVRLAVLRGDRKREVVLTVHQGALGATATGPRNVPRRAPTEFNWLGMEIETFTNALAAGSPGNDKLMGAVIAEVTPRTPAYRVGLRPNDIILEINNQPVGSAALMDQAIRRASGQQDNLVRVFRNGRDFLVFL